ncbi:MAG: LysE family translocator, partial [Allosphingosinicella sp.]
MLEIAGIALLPEGPLFVSFVFAGLALNIVPGADMTFVIASAARGGRRDGIVAALGIGVGTLFHILAAVAGLSAILASSPAAFTLIKWVGAAYLLWIALSLLRAPRDGAKDVAVARVSGWRLLR